MSIEEAELITQMYVTEHPKLHASLWVDWAIEKREEAEEMRDVEGLMGF